jgi:hypothetical protein
VPPNIKHALAFRIEAEKPKYFGALSRVWNTITTDKLVVFHAAVH